MSEPRTQVQITLPGKMMVMTDRGFHDIAVSEDGTLRIKDHLLGLIAVYAKDAWLGAMLLSTTHNPEEK